MHTDISIIGHEFTCCTIMQSYFVFLCIACELSIFIII